LNIIVVLYFVQQAPNLDLADSGLVHQQVFFHIGSSISLGIIKIGLLEGLLLNFS
jgi:hypothetical protein